MPGYDNLEIITNGVVTGRYDDNWLAVVERQPALEGRRPNHSVFERLLKVRARTLVVAPGLIERPYVFAGNDEPGVLLSTAVAPPDQPVGGAARRAGGRADRQRRR